MVTRETVIWSANGWERRDYPTIMDGIVVRYEQGLNTEISASRNRVCIDDVTISSDESHAFVQDIIRRAWRQHLALKPNQMRLYGRNEPLPED